MVAHGRSGVGRALRLLVVVVAAVCVAAAQASAQGVTSPIDVINADGSGQRGVGQLPEDIPLPGPPGFYGGSQARNPWSYDNREIAFLGPGPAIYALAVDSGLQRQLTPGVGYLPDWSPTAPLLAYVPSARLALRNVDPHHQHRHRRG